MNAELLNIWKNAAQKSDHSVRIYAEDLLAIIAGAERALLAAAPAPIQQEPVAPARQALHTMQYEDGRIGWYFDCDGHYIDVEKDGAGKYSVYFRDRATGKEGWLDQADSATPPALAGIQVQAAGDALDAARYRWLRDKARSVDWTRNLSPNSYTTACRNSANQMDTAIDAAMREQQT